MLHLRKPMYKRNKKVILISSISTIALILFFIPLYFNAGLVDILEEALSTALASLIRLIGNKLSGLLNDMEVGIEALVFNVENFTQPTILSNLNVSLLRDNTLSQQLFSIYTLFVYIATVVMSVLGIWIAVDFVKTGEDPKHKAVLKDRIKKLLISIVLLTSLPVLFDELMVINQLIIDVFRLVIIDTVGGNQFDGLFLSDVFKTMSEAAKDDIPLAVIYLMSVFLNAWLVIFYMIRDLAISLLFIIAPVICVLLPYRTDLVVKWFKEMASNIFTQAIQAMILAIVIMIASVLTKSEGMYDRIFALVAFCSFIPMTASVKRALGLEGEIGAAKSSAGVGAMFGAMALAGAAYKGAKGSISNIRGYNEDIKNIKAEQDLLKKSDFVANHVGGPMKGQPGGVQGNLVGAVGSGPGKKPFDNGTEGGGRGVGLDPNNRSATNRNFGVDVQGDYDNLRNGGYTATSRARQLQGMKANARRQRNKAILGGVTSAFGGALMGAGAAVYGNPVGSYMAANLGSDIGSDVGEISAGVATTGVQAGIEAGKDWRYGAGIRYDGEQNPALRSLFEGASLSSTPKDLFNIAKSNREINKQVIESNKSKEGYAAAHYRATGLDPSTMTEKQFMTERVAVLGRNTRERMGRFGSANRFYAKNTYRRPLTGVDNAPVQTDNLLTGNDLTLITGPSTPNPTLITGPSSPNPPIIPGPSSPNPPIIPGVGAETPILEDNSRLPLEEGSNLNISDNNDYDEMRENLQNLNNDLNTDFAQYQNNSDYIDLLNNIYSNIDKPHIGSDYSQLT